MHSEATPPRAASAGSLGAAALFAALAFVLYLGAGSFGFVNYDDPLYVSANPVVARGLTSDGFAWAFSFQAANWHPLTWLAHMLDVELFGLRPGAMHLVNVGLHALNTALLFLALARLTRQPWPSGVVAALFAAHPLRVQCVAWIAERKELLAGAFFFALLVAHERHARTRSRGAYVALIACMALGCMAKPMLVTAPFVLLLLDAWPLGRFQATNEARGSPWLEKLPLFLIAAATCVLTWLAQSSGHAIGALEQLPLAERVLASGMGLLAYLRASFWPAGLAAFYPHPLLAGRDLLVPGLAGIALALAVTLLAWRARRSHPPLFTGWCWFLGMLVPVLGLVQVGDQGWADRYAYLPTIGLALALVFELAAWPRVAPPLLVGAGLAASGLLAGVTLRILPHWRDSRALFERALSVTEGNWVAHNNLGLIYLERRELDRAQEQFEAALQALPSFPEARFNLGRTLEAGGDFPAATRAYLAFLEDHPAHVETLLALATLARADGDAARAQGYLERATESAPDDPRAWVALARALAERGELDRAANCAASALRVDPGEPDANLVLADVALKRNELDVALRRIEVALSRGGGSGGGAEAFALHGRACVLAQDLPGARKSFETAVALEPTSASARYDYGTLLLRLGEREAAANQFAAVRDLRPSDGQVLVALGVMALEDGRAAEALELFEQASERMPSSPLVLTNLAAAHERLGNWSLALAAYERSFEMAPPIPEAARAAAWILATGPDESLLDGARAVELASYALVRQAPNALEVLAAAQARAGDFEQAAERQQEAIQQARGPSQRRSLEERLALYRSGQAFTRPR